MPKKSIGTTSDIYPSWAIVERIVRVSLRHANWQQSAAGQQFTNQFKRTRINTAKNNGSVVSTENYSRLFYCHDINARFGLARNNSIINCKMNFHRMPQKWTKTVLFENRASQNDSIDFVLTVLCEKVEYYMKEL